MQKRKVLVQWIGHSDLRAMASELPAARQKELLGVLKGDASGQGGTGPTKTLLASRDFDEVILLSNYPRAWNEWFTEWLEAPARIVEVELEKPTDHAAIFQISDRQALDMKQRGEIGVLRDVGDLLLRKILLRQLGLDQAVADGKIDLRSIAVCPVLANQGLESESGIIGRATEQVSNAFPGCDFWVTKDAH